MTWSRSLFGRISFWWAAGFVLLGVATWLGRDDSWSHTVFYVTRPAAVAVYVDAHLTYLSILGGACAVFAAVYLALEQLRRGRRRRLLGGLHLTLMCVGVLMAWPPLWILVASPAPQRGVDPEDTARLWGTIAVSGYGLLLAAQLFFVAVLIDAFRREADPR